jgi:Ca2+-binding EF-hand superfamily protein
MRASQKRGLAGAAHLLPAVTLLLSGCGGATNPFSSSSDFDRTFIGAAQTWDLNKDGSVSCDEWKQYAATSFRESDSNGDGVLDQREFLILAKNDRLFEIANLSYYDANSDSKVTAQELADKPNTAFKLLDKNADCRIDRNESVQVYNVDKPKEKEYDNSSVGGARGGGGGY